ncbi:uncharacterized protein HD556DRAFT_727498 [Suillus plorans]|uniref:Uncharacterized protein n=1 Tax=Suillus plorans TaxID=116603 RepID=A0A9P7AIX9_9AGAM|nr:uncharacterized protein HD556DRAFT_727498 [Suillus plorans]KAG1790423.1 hypothetical protein HD556DRAFT_727498 [Suillus plorans]
MHMHPRCWPMSLTIYSMSLAHRCLSRIYDEFTFSTIHNASSLLPQHLSLSSSSLSVSSLVAWRADLSDLKVCCSTYDLVMCLLKSNNTNSLARKLIKSSCTASASMFIKLGSRRRWKFAIRVSSSGIPHVALQCHRATHMTEGAGH